MATRDVGDISTNPGGKSGSEWTSDTRESLLALWQLNGGPLSDVSGTNTLTASVSVETGFTAYSDGLKVSIIPAANNTGAATLDLGLGPKNILTQDGGALPANSLVAGRLTEMEFVGDQDAFLLKGSSGTTNVTVSGGIILQRSAPSRLGAAVAETTDETTVGSIAFQAGYSTSRVIIEGAFERVTGAGSASGTGTTIKLYVDDVEVQSFTGTCQPSETWSTPFYFEYLPGDTDAHTYAVTVTSSIAAAYSAGACQMVCSEMSPNT